MLAPTSGSPHAPPARDRAAAGRRPAVTSYAVTGRRCATPSSSSWTTAAPPTARTSRVVAAAGVGRRRRAAGARARRGRCCRSRPGSAGIALLGGAKVSLVRLLDVPDDARPCRARPPLRPVGRAARRLAAPCHPGPAASAGSTYLQRWRCSGTTTWCSGLDDAAALGPRVRESSPSCDGPPGPCSIARTGPLWIGCSYDRAGAGPCRGRQGEPLVVLSGVQKHFGAPRPQGHRAEGQPRRSRRGDRTVRVRQVDAVPHDQPSRDDRRGTITLDGQPLPRRGRSSRRYAPRSGWCSRASTSSPTRRSSRTSRSARSRSAG